MVVCDAVKISEVHIPWQELVKRIFLKGGRVLEKTHRKAAWSLFWNIHFLCLLLTYYTRAKNLYPTFQPLKIADSLSFASPMPLSSFTYTHASLIILCTPHSRIIPFIM